MSSNTTLDPSLAILLGIGKGMLGDVRSGLQSVGQQFAQHPIETGLDFSPLGDLKALLWDAPRNALGGDFGASFLSLAAAIPGIPNTKNFFKNLRAEDILKHVEYRRPVRLDAIAPTVYRETNMDGALDFIPTTNRASLDFDLVELPAATSENLALGQANNKGILLEFDAQGLVGRVNTEKPTFAYMWDDLGEAEVVMSRNRQSVYQDALSSVTLRPDRLKFGTKSEKFLLEQRLLPALEEQGWIKATLDDGSIKYTRPR